MGEWIAHDGGKCPVYVDTKVDVRWNGGAPDKSFCSQTGALPIEAGCVAAWPLVTHYRLAEPEQPSEHAHIQIPNTIPLNDVIDEFRKDPAFAAEIDKARIDLQAHMMAAPRNRMLTADELEASIRACYPESEAPTTERKHISDAAWQATMASKYGAKHAHMRGLHEAANAEIGIVLLAVAEHDELEEMNDRWHAMYVSLVRECGELRAERDSLRAEVERFTQCLQRANDQAEHFEREWYLRGDEIERLRKGREDEESNQAKEAAVFSEASASEKTSRGQAILRAASASVASALDPRLGTPQPDGEPVAPMSGRMAYRWGMV